MSTSFDSHGMQLACQSRQQNHGFETPSRSDVNRRDPLTCNHLQLRTAMWQRAVAFLIDLLPLAVLAGVENALGIADYLVVAALNLLLLIAYFATMNYQFGGTIGKRIMGLRVALPSTPSVGWRLVGRAFAKVVFLAPPFATVYALVAIWREDGRSFADFISNTTVVEVGTLTVPGRLSLPKRLLASALALFAPWVLVFVIGLCLFGMMLFAKLLKSL